MINEISSRLLVTTSRSIVWLHGRWRGKISLFVCLFRRVILLFPCINWSNFLFLWPHPWCSSIIIMIINNDNQKIGPKKSPSRSGESAKPPLQCLGSRGPFTRNKANHCVRFVFVRVLGRPPALASPPPFFSFDKNHELREQLRYYVLFHDSSSKWPPNWTTQLGKKRNDLYKSYKLNCGVWSSDGLLQLSEHTYRIMNHLHLCIEVIVLSKCFFFWGGFVCFIFISFLNEINLHNVYLPLD